jgi:hypothetical protein
MHALDRAHRRPAKPNDTSASRECERLDRRPHDVLPHALSMPGGDGARISRNGRTACASPARRSATKRAGRLSGPCSASPRCQCRSSSQPAAAPMVRRCWNGCRGPHGARHAARLYARMSPDARRHRARSAGRSSRAKSSRLCARHDVGSGSGRCACPTSPRPDHHRRARAMGARRSRHRPAALQPEHVTRRCSGRRAQHGVLREAGFSYKPMVTDETAASCRAGRRARFRHAAQPREVRGVREAADRRSHHAHAGAVLLQRVILTRHPCRRACALRTRPAAQEKSSTATSTLPAMSRKCSERLLSSVRSAQTSTPWAASR